MKRLKYFGAYIRYYFRLHKLKRCGYINDYDIDLYKEGIKIYYSNKGIVPKNVIDDYIYR